MFIDSHCHFDFDAFDLPNNGANNSPNNSRDQHWQAAQETGVDALVIPGVKADGWHKLLWLAHNKPWYAFLGLHPYFIEAHKPEDVGVLEQLLKNEQVLGDSLQNMARIYGIGEIGLDYYQHHKDTRKQQLFYFEAQLDLAKRYQKPVIIHARKSDDDVLQSLHNANLSQAGVIHAFSGSLQQAERYISLGFKLGFGGALTYQRATKLRRVFQNVPLSAIVFETDAPDMNPCFVPKNERNHPKNLPEIIKRLAGYRQERYDEIVEKTRQNTCDVLGISGMIVP